MTFRRPQKEGERTLDQFLPFFLYLLLIERYFPQRFEAFFRGAVCMSANFKFKYVQAGNTKGFLASKGSVTEAGLNLGDFCLPYSCIIDSTTRDDRIVLTIDPRRSEFPAPLGEQLQGYHLVLAVMGVKAENLERAIDRFSSHYEAQAHKKELEAAGNGHLYRTVTCPCCEATVDLSELPQTSFTYCRFCETVFGEGLHELKDSISYRECDECGYHDRVQGYGEFYFYFLLVIYGFKHQRRHMCDACGATLANKLILANSIFMLGVPNAIGCAIRARTGKDPQMKSLAAANRLAKKGRLSEADQQYNAVLQVFRDHPGVRFNQALAYLTAGQTTEGLGHLKTAIEACPNYQPALGLVHRLTASE